MSRWMIRLLVLSLVVASNAICVGRASSQKGYDPAVSDTEIRIGNTNPYSGPASALSIIGRTQESYFRKINDEGGINGRKIKFISYDDAYSPPKTVEQARRLVESDDVLLIFSPIGTATSSAIHKYLNTKKIPMLFIGSGASKFADPKNFPWAMGFLTSNYREAKIYAQFILKERPNAKIAILYQNDDFGKDLLQGFKSGIVGASATIVAEASYETSEPTVESQIVRLRASGADVFLNFSVGKFASQAIRRSAEIGWAPLQIVPMIATSLGSVIKPAGFQNAQNLYSAAFAKDPSDSQWNNDPGMKRFYEFLSSYMPNADKSDNLIGVGYTQAQTLIQVLKQCGDDLSRENVMRQAANLHNFESDVLLPGIQISTSPSDFEPIEQTRMMRLKGAEWEHFGPVLP